MRGRNVGQSAGDSLEEGEALLSKNLLGHLGNGSPQQPPFSASATGAPARSGGAPQYESLDYEEVENVVFRSDKAAGTTLSSLLESSSKWVIAFLIGVTTAIAAFTVNWGVENIAGFKFWVTLMLMKNGWVFGSLVTYVAMNAALVFVAVSITVWFGPAAAGSGIADVKAYLNGIDVPGIFYLNTLIAKVVGSVGAVAGGLAIGKEGPFVHAGACIAALLSQGGSHELPIPWFDHIWKPFWNDRDRADNVLAGAAAGVAAAFRSPVGGVLFALEEMSSWWSSERMWRIFFTTAVVSVTVRVLMKMTCTQDSCGFFGSGGFIIFEVSEGQENFLISELLPVLLLGIVGGLLGSVFISLNARLVAWRREHLAPHGAKAKVAEALLISVLTSGLSFLLPLLSPCQECPLQEGIVCPRQDGTHNGGNFISFGCGHQAQYSDLATLFFNTQDDAIRNLFSSKTKREYTVSSLTMFSTVFFGLAVLTYGIATPTGLFVPSILTGAAYGRLVGIFVADMHPHHYIDEGTYALLGAASFLGGTMRITMCTCVMLLELTNNLALLPLIMVVLLVAKAVGDGTGIKPIYEVQMKYKGLPFLGPSPDSFLRHIAAKECCGRPPVTFQRVERVQRIVDVLKSCNHNGFPVIQTSPEGDRNIMGVVLRQHLLVLLSTRRSFQPSPYVAEGASRVAMAYVMADFAKPISSPGLSLGDVLPTLPEDQLSLYLDLGPYANPSPYVVQEDASLSKVYTMFRTLGLRHLFIIPKAHEVVGVITREDLLPHTIETRFEAGGGQYMADGTTISDLMLRQSSSSALCDAVRPMGTPPRQGRQHSRLRETPPHSPLHPRPQHWGVQGQGLHATDAGGVRRAYGAANSARGKHRSKRKPRSLGGAAGPEAQQHEGSLDDEELAAATSNGHARAAGPATEMAGIRNGHVNHDEVASPAPGGSAAAAAAQPHPLSARSGADGEGISLHGFGSSGGQGATGFGVSGSTSIRGPPRNQRMPSLSAWHQQQQQQDPQGNTSRQDVQQDSIVPTPL